MSSFGVKLCSQALIKLGAEPILSFDDDTDRARICAAIYDDLVAEIIGGYDWWFATKKTKLSRENITPTNEYKYQFIMPGDAGSDGPVAVYNSGGVGTKPIFDYELYGSRLMANDPEIWIDFKYIPNGSFWPSWFKAAVVACICADIAFAITDQQNTADGWERKAYGPSGRGSDGGLLGKAYILDSQGQSLEFVPSDELIAVR